MRRILLVSEIFPPTHGGSGRWFSEIYGRFPQKSVVFLVGVHPDSKVFDLDFPHDVYRYNLNSPEWGLRSLVGLKYYWSIWRKLRSIGRDTEAQQVHCGRVLPEGVAALMLKMSDGIPYSCYVHGEDVETALSSRELTWLTKKVMHHAERIICNSQNSFRILREKWNLSPEKIVVMNPGVDLEHFCVNASTAPPPGWSGKINILTVGRLQRRKGQDMMIRALPELLKEFPDVQYSIIGGGEERRVLEVLADELGVASNVQFLGEVDDTEMVACYSHCDLFVLPNRRVGNDDEGFGMVLLEAQACSRPVLAGDSGGTRETLEEGVTGIVVDCREPETITEALINLLRNPGELDRMGEAGRRHVEKRFSWEMLAENAQNHFL